MAFSRLPRLAIIGCGRLTELHLAPALQRIGWTPSVLVDRSDDRVELVSGILGRPGDIRLARDWEDVERDFDAAVVAVPPAGHCFLGTALATAGKHVFMEKPLAVTWEECERMKSVAATSDVVLSVGLLRRYLRGARWLKALLESGRLGEIVRFDAHEGWVFGYQPVSGSLLERHGGVLTDTGTHLLDLLQWWLGPIQPVRYRDDGLSGVESDAILECQLESGAPGRVEMSRTRKLRDTVRIQGDRGFVEVHVAENRVILGSPNVLAFHDEGVTGLKMPEQAFPDLFDAELADFRESMTTGRHRGVSWAEGAESVRLIEQCYSVRRELEVPWAPRGGVPAFGSGETTLQALPEGSRVLVTGATGFIGGRLAERLLVERNAKVRCLIRNYGTAVRLARLPVEIEKGDLGSPEDVSRAVRDVDYVFHCAYDPSNRAQNITGLCNLVAACAEHRVHRLVHVSTFSVYEPFADGPLSEQSPDGDRDIDYIDIKLDLERMAFEAAQKQGVPVTIVQPAIVYGPYSTYWTDKPARALLKGQMVLPDEGGICNPVHVDDLVDGLALAAVSQAAVGERFILSGPDWVTWEAFFDAFARVLDVGPPHLWPRERIRRLATEKRTETGARSADSGRSGKRLDLPAWPGMAFKAVVKRLPARLQAAVMARSVYECAPKYNIPDLRSLALYGARAVVSIDKARRLLGYSPRLPFEDGLARTAPYVRWAYGDRARELARERTHPGRAPMSVRRMPLDWMSTGIELEPMTDYRSRKTSSAVRTG